MKKNEISIEELKQIKYLQDKKNQEQLKRFILDQTEAKVKDKFSDKELDTENVKRLLLESIEDFWKVETIEGKIVKVASKYESIYIQDYYKEIYRLNNWKYDGIIAQKPWIVGRYTNEIIYYRFSQEVLPFLRIMNPYIIPGVRKHKHHQYLTPGARAELSIFISQAVTLMRECHDWNEFRIKYCKRYNVPYQLKLF